jgi:hypothetical protein
LDIISSILLHVFFWKKFIYFSWMHNACARWVPACFPCIKHGALSTPFFTNKTYLSQWDVQLITLCDRFSYYCWILIGLWSNHILITSNKF